MHEWPLCTDLTCTFHSLTWFAFQFSWKHPKIELNWFLFWFFFVYYILFFPDTQTYTIHQSNVTRIIDSNNQDKCFRTSSFAFSRKIFVFQNLSNEILTSDKHTVSRTLTYLICFHPEHMFHCQWAVRCCYRLANKWNKMQTMFGTQS